MSRMTPASPRAEAAAMTATSARSRPRRNAGIACHALLEDDQAAAHLVEGRRPVFADFVGIPGGLDLAAKRRVHLVTFGNVRSGRSLAASSDAMRLYL